MPDPMTDQQPTVTLTDDQREAWRQQAERGRVPSDLAGDWILALLDENDALRARLAAMPEATETVEWGFQTEPGGYVYPCSERDDAEDHVANTRVFHDGSVVRRTVRTFAPQVGEWEEVPADE